MPTIQEEYARLLKMAETEEGYDALDAALLKAQNYERAEGGGVIKLGVGAGPMTAGWAIDNKTLNIVQYPRGRDHAAAQHMMISSLIDEGVDYDVATHRAVRVWASYTDLFELPLIMVDGTPYMDEDEIQRLESAFIDKGLGLPVAAISLKWIMIKQEKRNSKRLKSKTVESK